MDPLTIGAALGGVANRILGFFERKQEANLLYEQTELEQLPPWRRPAQTQVWIFVLILVLIVALIGFLIWKRGT